MINGTPHRFQPRRVMQCVISDQLKILLQVSHVIPTPSDVSIIKRRSKRHLPITLTASSKKARHGEDDTSGDEEMKDAEVMASAQSKTSNASSTSSKRFRGREQQSVLGNGETTSPASNVQPSSLSGRNNHSTLETLDTIPEDLNAEERMYDAEIHYNT